MELVENRKGVICCDTGMVARKFGMQHAKVAKAMVTLIPKLDDFRVTGFHPRYEEESRIYHGTEYKAYLLNRDCFILLGMRFDTKKARQWQGKILAAFNAMEQRLIAADKNSKDQIWIDNRSQGKLARQDETDTIKDFVEYATEQGSKSAKFYYKHVTNASYKALGMIVQRKPKLRDTMNIRELAELQLMEHRATVLLKKYMDLGRDYKDIYTSVKDDLLSFGDSLLLTEK